MSNLGLYLSVKLPSYGGVPIYSSIKFGRFYCIYMCVCVLEVCTVPGLARGPYLARHVGRAGQANVTEFFRRARTAKEKSIFKRAGPVKEKNNFKRAGQAKEK